MKRFLADKICDKYINNDMNFRIKNIFNIDIKLTNLFKHFQYI